MKHFTLLERGGGGGGGGALPENFHQNPRFSPPYLWPDQKFDNLFTAVAADTGSLNISFEGLLFMVLSIMMKK